MRQVAPGGNVGQHVAAEANAAHVAFKMQSYATCPCGRSQCGDGAWQRQRELSTFCLDSGDCAVDVTAEEQWKQALAATT